MYRADGPAVHPAEVDALDVRSGKDEDLGGERACPVRVGGRVHGELDRRKAGRQPVAAAAAVVGIDRRHRPGLRGGDQHQGRCDPKDTLATQSRDTILRCVVVGSPHGH